MQTVQKVHDATPGNNIISPIWWPNAVTIVLLCFRGHFYSNTWFRALQWPSPVGHPTVVFCIPWLLFTKKARAFSEIEVGLECTILAFKKREKFINQQLLRTQSIRKVTFYGADDLAEKSKMSGAQILARHIERGTGTDFVTGFITFGVKVENTAFFISFS